MPSNTTPVAPRDPATPARPAGDSDNVFESIGKAITDVVWESSGEADKSHKGDARRIAGEKAREDKAREDAQDER